MPRSSKDHVFATLITERQYQDAKWRGQVPQSPAAFLTFMRHHMRRAEELISTQHTADDALHQIRKITALGVACLEAHGAPERDPAEIFAADRESENGLRD